MAIGEHAQPYRISLFGRFAVASPPVVIRSGALSIGVMMLIYSTVVFVQKLNAGVLMISPPLAAMFAGGLIAFVIAYHASRLEQ